MNFLMIFLYFLEKDKQIHLFSVNKEGQIDFFNKIENIDNDQDKITFSKGYILYQIYKEELSIIEDVLTKGEFQQLEKAILNEIHKKYGVFNKDTIIKNIKLPNKLLFVLYKFIDHLEENINKVESSLLWEEDFKSFIDSYDPNEIYNKNIK